MRSWRAYVLDKELFDLQGVFSALAMMPTSDFTIYSDRSGDPGGTVGCEFVSELASRPSSTC